MFVFFLINSLAYTNCVNEPFCAAKAVQGYMAKFGQVIYDTLSYYKAYSYYY